MVVGKLLRLRGNRFGNLLTVIADIDTVEPGKGIEQLVAVAILDMNAGTAGNDPVRRFAPRVLGKMG